MTTGSMLRIALNEMKEYVVWLTVILLVALGLRHAKNFIAFILDKLYQFLIQNNSRDI